MTGAIADALHQLQRHRGLIRVGEPRASGESTQIDVDVAVQLPSRSRRNGVSETGVRAVETCVLVFSRDWPLSAPRPFLRADFPLNLPHINPHREGDLVSPCVFEGSLDELLHRFGLDAIVDQLIDWLHKAAAGTLLDLEQGWEPTRRDSCPSTVVFSAEKVAAAAPMDGTILVVPAGYVTVDGGLYAIINAELTAQAGPVFYQDAHNDKLGKWGNGHTAAFIARAPMTGGQPHVVDRYQPETVVDLPTLLDRSAELGIDRDALAQSLDGYYGRSILDMQQDSRGWVHGLYAIVILTVDRPAPLVGSSGRNVEVLPYVVRYELNVQSLLERNATVHPAFHAHSLSPELLARTSGIPSAATSKSLIVLGCGSVGSKIAMQLGRAGFGSVTFVDNESMSPHNAARHALIGRASVLVPPRKAALMKTAFESLSHLQSRAFDTDAVTLLVDPAQFAVTVPPDTTLIVDATASLQVLAAETQSVALNQSSARLARIAMYGQGHCVAVLLEGLGRAGRVDDLTAFLFERCRFVPELRASIAGDTSEPTRIFVGDNCRSLTMPMSDAVVSRSASLAGLQLERWLVDGFPEEATLCAGISDAEGLGMAWTRTSLGPTTVLGVADDGGWSIRILHQVAQAIHDDALRWGALETGGALVGRISFENRTITIAGLVDAPLDSVRETGRFVLGTNGLVQNLRAANAASLGYLAFIGTWHSHPKGGAHSGIDRNTLSGIAEDAGGLPAVSLVWTPTGLTCAVDRW
ncbi:ThiF family adenylyltransferase [Burkholderia cenocepacia]|uniref:ThiF family adenylyltransferase n=1 Tax=Burkholderia cenocepacia TaxID=95486 RepID=UPI000982259E|nr:ThiF family adenylyltransferase [Burkholderia cenocepacia]AQQ26185.1 thiamine biosynthesis protein ThiF [Burkholderia cenocepacia]ONV82114.1 thiamine biosynthesis protein ThiF [Burkholderia cenocepacia]ONW12926.1 thiamine biosynthesis protein ThiF [Burkholderia cenocepacia]ONW20686.1 thiamine biosynthesis protein ThiF [Burkholderia cenocepacia]ONW31955.1 thiamine biosynthesis protein ThiF [Burkholderia cenocepacia]